MILTIAVTRIAFGGMVVRPVALQSREVELSFLRRLEGHGWFPSYHAFTLYVKMTFLNGSSFTPLSPVASKDKATRYFHIYVNEQTNEELVASCVRQAASMPGWHGF